MCFVLDDEPTRPTSDLRGVQLRNARGKNAQQLAEEVFAPPCLLLGTGGLDEIGDEMG